MSYRTLRERLEKATGPDRELDKAIWETLGQLRMYESVVERNGDFALRYYPGPPGPEYTRLPRLSASLDAAIGLVERLLPGWSRQSGKEIDPDGGFDFWTSLSPGEQPFPAELDITVVHDHSEPISIVLALLRALEAKEAS